jgi:hypothetical protein
MEPFKTKLSIKAGVVNENGRMYSKECLEKAFAAKDNLFIMSGVSQGTKIDPSQIIGSVDEVEIQDDGDIVITGKSWYPLNEFKLFPDGVGVIDIMGKVSNFAIVSLSVSGVSAEIKPVDDPLIFSGMHATYLLGKE